MPGADGGPSLVGLLIELQAEGLILRRRADEDDVLGALTGRQRDQLFELLQKATAGRALDCAGAAVEREPGC